MPSLPTLHLESTILTPKDKMQVLTSSHMELGCGSSHPVHVDVTGAPLSTPKHPVTPWSSTPRSSSTPRTFFAGNLLRRALRRRRGEGRAGRGQAAATGGSGPAAASARRVAGWARGSGDLWCQMSQLFLMALKSILKRQTNGKTTKTGLPLSIDNGRTGVFQ